MQTVDQYQKPLSYDPKGVRTLHIGGMYSVLIHRDLNRLIQIFSLSLANFRSNYEHIVLDSVYMNKFWQEPTSRLLTEYFYTHSCYISCFQVSSRALVGVPSRAAMEAVDGSFFESFVYLYMIFVTLSFANDLCILNSARENVCI